MNETKRCARYARVACASKTDTDKINDQLAVGEDIIKNIGGELVGDYVDVGVSGNKKMQPGLTRLMEDVSKGKFELVVITESTRLARNCSLLHELTSELRSSGVDIMCCNSGELLPSTEKLAVDLISLIPKRRLRRR